MTFTPEGARLVVIDLAGKIRHFNPGTGIERRPHFMHDGVVFVLAFSSDGKTLVSEEDDRTMRF